MSDARRARRLRIPDQIASADEGAGATRYEDDAAAAEGGGRGGSSTVHASSAREVPHSILLGFVVVAGVVPPDKFVSWPHQVASKQSMWNASSAIPGGSVGYYGNQPIQQQLPPPTQPGVAAAANTGPKHDIFVGNLAFATTEEQLHTIFSEIGRVVRVRMVCDIETGKPRGFAFVEFEDPQAALSAIRNMNEYEINGRKLRVNFSNSSHLETLANQLGMDLSSSAGAGSGGHRLQNSCDPLASLVFFPKLQHF